MTGEAVGPYETAGTFSHQAQRTFGYKLNTATAGMSKGTYVLRVSLSDGSLHTIKLIVR